VLRLVRVRPLFTGLWFPGLPPGLWPAFALAGEEVVVQSLQLC
jgi:hypothetical protein